MKLSLSNILKYHFKCQLKCLSKSIFKITLKYHFKCQLKCLSKSIFKITLKYHLKCNDLLTFTGDFKLQITLSLDSPVNLKLSVKKDVCKYQWF